MTELSGDSKLSLAERGALAGLMGTVAITFVRARIPAALEKLGLEKPVLPPEEPTERLAEKVASSTLQTPVDPETKKTAGQVIHWGYGAAWGAAYGLEHGRVPLSPLVNSTLFGTLVGGVASTVVPTLRLVPPPSKQPISQKTADFLAHLIYGWTTALAFKALT